MPPGRMNSRSRPTFCGVSAVTITSCGAVFDAQIEGLRRHVSDECARSAAACRQRRARGNRAALGIVAAVRCRRKRRSTSSRRLVGKIQRVVKPLRVSLQPQRLARRISPAAAARARRGFRPAGHRRRSACPRRLPCRRSRSARTSRVRNPGLLTTRTRRPRSAAAGLGFGLVGQPLEARV